MYVVEVVALSVLPRLDEHLRCHVYPNYVSTGANNSRSQKAIETSPASEIKYRLARLEVRGTDGVPTTNT